ncbi:MAG: hypothetical protein MI784_03310 [Cytophagales bacterium]|nr:hypothetical protein [Cytophagales bacterium]
MLRYIKIAVLLLVFLVVFSFMLKLVYWAGVVFMALLLTLIVMRAIRKRWLWE